MSNIKLVQKVQLAGKTKLTLVSKGHGDHKHVFFLRLKHNEQGEAVLPLDVFNQVLTSKSTVEKDEQ